MIHFSRRQQNELPVVKFWKSNGTYLQVISFINQLMHSVTRQRLVPSMFVSAVRPLTDSDGTRCSTYTIEPPEDEHNDAQNM